MTLNDGLTSHRFQPGVSGNPTGRPRGARNRLGEAFIAALLSDWQTHGAKAIERLRERDPAGYVRAVIQLVPRGAVDTDDAQRLKAALLDFVSDIEDLHDRVLR